MFKLSRKTDWIKAADCDLFEVVTAKYPLYVERWVLEALSFAIIFGEITHLSGPTGCGKSTLINHLPRNWKNLCRNLDVEYRPLKKLRVDLKDAEQTNTRRALKNGNTFDEPVGLRLVFEEGLKHQSSHYVVIHIPEIGRFNHTNSVENGLINYLQDDIMVDNVYLGTNENIAVILDSNLQAQTGEYNLDQPDLALQSRMTCHITLDYLSLSQEYGVVDKLAEGSLSPEEIYQMVKFAHLVREKKRKGALRRVPMPTFRQYLSIIKRSKIERGFDLDRQLARTYYGTAPPEEYEMAETLKNQVLNGLVQSNEKFESANF